LRNQITDRSFRLNRLESEFVNQTDFYWFGLKWVRPERSYALSLRSRVASRYQLGQGLFSDQLFDKNGDITFDQSFNQRYQSLHELSFGFAESFTLLNGLFRSFPNLSLVSLRNWFLEAPILKQIITTGYEWTAKR
jgi:hypothetical protein